MQFQQLSKEAILPLACNVFAGVTAFYGDAQIKHSVSHSFKYSPCTYSRIFFFNIDEQLECHLLQQWLPKMWPTTSCYVI